MWTQTEYGDTLTATRPAVLHHQTLTTELLAATGTKPSLRGDLLGPSRGKPLVALFPRATLTAEQRAAAEAAIAAHDGTAALAADATATATRLAARQTRADALAALRAKYRDGVPADITAADLQRAVFLLLRG